MTPDPGVRFRLLRRITVALTATSLACAGILYLQVSGTLAGLAGAVFGGARASDSTTPAPGGERVQPPVDNPAPGNGGVPIARTGGS
jgi:hypothetical protein